MDFERRLFEEALGRRVSCSRGADICHPMRINSRFADLSMRSLPTVTLCSPPLFNVMTHRRCAVGVEE